MCDLGCTTDTPVHYYRVTLDEHCVQNQTQVIVWGITNNR